MIWGISEQGKGHERGAIEKKNKVSLSQAHSFTSTITHLFSFKIEIVRLKNTS